MRMESRSIGHWAILGAVESYEIIDANPYDKYLPSYLVWMSCDEEVVHVLFAVDVEEQTVRVVTAYRPKPLEWVDDMKRRVV